MLPIKIELPKGFFEEEVRSGYTVSEEQKKVWAVELDLLNELLRVCRKHDIKIYTDGGTTLGAARHKGFIPWDDDIDMAMTRENYKKLCEYAAKEFQYPYFFQTEETDPGSMRGHAQLRNSATTGILSADLETGLDINHGIFIDIFPLDELPDMPNERKKHLDSLKKMRLRMHRVAVCTGYCPSSMQKGLNGKIKKVILPIGKVIDRLFHINQALFLAFEKKASLYNGKGERQVGSTPLVATHRNLIFDRSHFEGEIEYVDFEVLKVPMPARYDEYLVAHYGDWHKFVVGTSLHGGVVFDPEKPYKEYLREKRQAEGK